MILGQRIARFIDGFSVWLVYVATGCVAFMMLLGVVDTLSGKLANQPLPGYFELTEVAMVLIIFFPLAYVQRERKHIAMTAFTDTLPRKAQLGLEVLALLISLFAVSMVAWAGSKAAWKSVQVGEFYPGVVQYPVYPWKVAFVLGVVTLGLKLICDAVKRVSELVELPASGRSTEARP